MKRRTFIKKTGLGLAATSVSGLALTSCSNLLSEDKALALSSEIPANFPFGISLAQWSLHKSHWSGALDNLDFAQYTREKFDLGAVEYVNQFFADKAEDTDYLNQMNQRAADNGVKNVLIMIDLEGNLAVLDETARLKAVENHYKWIDAAKILGCHSIRVNAVGKGDRESVADAAVDSLGRLAEYGAKEKIGVVVENHGGYSSDAKWLAGVMKQVDNPFCGTLPDFGNFRMSLFPPKSYDPYLGVKELMPYAKGVSAKAHDFDTDGQDKQVDFKRMMDIVGAAGYSGYIGIEYEGYKLSEDAGILATKKLIIDSVG
jgi:sugar phosphate isomerase/epimerase